MHFFEDTLSRESNLTDLVVDLTGYYELPELIEFKEPFGIILGFQKTAYNREGDVDILFAPLKDFIKNGSIDISKCVAIEVKTCYFNENKEFKSVKKNKHIKQLQLLKEEGWGRIFLCDIAESLLQMVGLMPRDF
jgi:hypothetical protein